jgi:hypothetical protein
MTKREDPDYVDPIRTEQDYRGESRRVLTLNWTTVGMLVLALLFVSVVSLLMPHSFGTKSANQQVCTWLAGVQSRFAPQFAALPVVSATQEDAGAFENLLNQEATEYATEYMNTGSEFVLRSAEEIGRSHVSISGVRPASVSGIPESAAFLSAMANRRRIRPATASFVIGGLANEPSSSRLA